MAARAGPEVAVVLGSSMVRLEDADGVSERPVGSTGSVMIVVRCAGRVYGWLVGRSNAGGGAGRLGEEGSLSSTMEGR